MARIAWNPIDAPNIGSSAIQAQQAAGASIQNAFSGLRGVLGEWEGQRRDDNLEQLFARQNAFAGKDPAEYEAALRSGKLNQGLTYLRPEDMVNARAYAGDLRRDRNSDASFEQNKTTFANTQTRFGWETTDRERSNEERLAMRGAYEELLPAIAAARATGDPTAMDSLLSQAAAKYKNISTDGLMKLFSAGSEAGEEGRSRQSHNLNMARGQFGLETDQTNFDQAQDLRAEGRNIQALDATVRSLAGGLFDDPVSKKAALEQAITGGNYTAREIAQWAAANGVAVPLDIAAQIEGTDGAPNRSFAGGTGRGAVGDRNFNAGNVRDVGQFAGQPGYIGTDSRGFAKFSSAEAGANVTADQLGLYMSGRSRNVPRGGIQTVDQIIKTWAPVGPENSAESVKNYVDYVAQRLGVKPGDKLTQADIPRLSQAIGEFENGRTQRGVLTASQQRWGEGASANPGRLATTAVAAAGPGNPTVSTGMIGTSSFLTAAEQTVSNASHALSLQNGAIGLESAARFDATQAVRRPPAVAAQSAIAPGKDGQGGGVFAGTGVEPRRLSGAIQKLIDESGRSITADTAAQILSESTVRGRNLAGQAAGNVYALGNDIRVDMVQAAQVARSLGGQGGAAQVANARSVATGQTQMAGLSTEFTNTLARYKTGLAQDATNYGEGQMSAATRAQGERLVALDAQIKGLTARSESSARQFAGNGGTGSAAPRPRNGRNYAATASINAAAPAAAPTPQQRVNQRTNRQDQVRALGRSMGNPLAGGLANLMLDARDRLRGE